MMNRQIKMNWWRYLLTVVILIAATSAVFLLPPKMVAYASQDSIGISIEVSNQADDARLSVEYPPEITTAQEKLFAIYSLIEQMRLEYNKQGAIAASDMKAYGEKWAAYDKAYKEKQLALLNEQNRLKDEIRKSIYTDKQWQSISTGDEELKLFIYETMYGNKPTEKVKPTLATSQLLEEVRTLNVKDINPEEIIDPVEDFSTYTENDPTSKITITSTRVTYTAVNRSYQDWCYVVKDFTANHFAGDFSHLVTCYDSGSQSYGKAAVWALTNDAPNKFTYAGSTIIALELFASTTYVQAQEIYNGSEYVDAYDGSAGTVYYCTVTRTGSNFSIYIYSNSGRTTLLDTVSLALHSTIQYRYLYAFNGYHESNANTASGYSENFDLQETVTPAMTNAPSSKAFGVQAPSITVWSNGAEPEWVLNDGDAFFTITNSGTVAIDISIECTDFTGGSTWNIVSTSPSGNEVRMTAFKEGDDSDEGVVVSNDPQAFIASLAASATIDWEFCLDLTSTHDSSQRTGTITLEASAS